jgi:hypothetical protein
VCAIVVTWGLAATSVRAVGNGPTIFKEVVDDTFVTNFCGFPMQVRSTGTAIVHLFLDENGDVQRAIITAPQTRMTFTNLDTGKTVWTPSVNMVLSEANEDGTTTQSLRGLLWHLIVPGEGLITADVGRLDYRLTFDNNGNIIDEEVVFSAGIQEGQFVPTLCSVLG